VVNAYRLLLLLLISSRCVSFRITATTIVSIIIITACSAAATAPAIADLTLLLQDMTLLATSAAERYNYVPYGALAFDRVRTTKDAGITQ